MSTLTSKIQLTTAVFAVAAAATLAPVAIADDETDAASSDTTSASVGSAAGQAPTRSARKDRPLPTSQSGGTQSSTGSTPGSTTPSTDSTAAATDDRASTSVDVADSNATSNAVGQNPLFQNPLIWIGQPNPNPPASTTIYEFKPLADLPEFTRPMFGWLDNFAFEACALGLGTTVRGQNVLGPYDSSITSVGTSGCA